MNARQYSFIELSKKTVVNVADGKELGNTCDLIFNGCGTIGGLVVPGKKSFLKKGAKFLRKNVRCKVERKTSVRQNRDTLIYFVRWLYRRGK